MHNLPLEAIKGWNIRQARRAADAGCHDDMARAHDALRTHLGITRVSLIIGASLGGQQVLEWSIEQPELFDRVVLIATNARHSAFGIAFNESQRLA
ncbi:MAG: alpha/beta fold hydrolase, partial [Alphaproteobacteria bacterium]